MYDEAPHDDSCGGVAGDAEGEHGDQCAAGNRVIGGFGGDQPLGHAGAELFRRLGGPLFLRVGQEAAGAAADARQQAHEGTDGRSPQIGAPAGQGFAQGREETGKAHSGLDPVGFFMQMARRVQKFRNREQADQYGEDFKTGIHFSEAEGETPRTVNGTLPHTGEKQSQQR